ncbi:MAG: type I 3-dehydroquinate dehydratase [Planctomycetes bacterium]|nr:type I 3-dehydroquinate dehydratase [Planctomycetota bacterium]
MAERIASVFANGAEQVLRDARRAAMDGADLLELRLDRWPTDGDLSGTLARIALPVLATCRLPRDGGFFAGSLDERRALLRRALEAGAHGLDLEEWEEWDPPDDPRLELHVRSCHVLDGLPQDLPALQRRLFARGADLVKIVGTVRDLADAAPLVDFLGAVDQENEPTVAFALGRSAWPTRVLAALQGAPFVYASVPGAEPTAPGQAPLDLLAGLYDVRDLGRTTLIYGLLGNPALHSVGPWLHNRAFRQLGLDAVYLPFETARPEAVVAMLPRRRLRGLSVTMPHKAAMARLCHRLDDSAEETEVVNTVVFQAHGQIVGHNSDVAGVLGALQGAGVAVAEPGARAAVLGAGGAARAAVVALQRLGFAVAVFARRPETLAGFARLRGVTTAPLAAQPLREFAPGAVVHATPLGGPGHEGERILPEWTPAAGTLVLDMVYRPRWTPLLRAAQAAGARPIPGMAMFLAQAAEQLRWFTGESLPVAQLGRFLTGVA